jgi:hypothetical protein
MWDREGAEKEERNTIVHSFNRNFSKRADGNPNTLAELHKMGFETFPEIFDESYDTIEDEDERLASIMRSVTKLCSLSLEELHKLYFSVYPKLVHNRNLLLQFTKTQRVRNKVLHLISL